MKRMVEYAGVLAVIAAAPVVLSATAQADAPGNVAYFSYGQGINCAIAADGVVGCDVAPRQMTYYAGGAYIPVPFPVSQVVIDQPWLPAHPGRAAGTIYTIPGGNPNIDTVKTGDGQWGSIISHAGATCEVGFRGSLTCQTKGRAFTFNMGTIIG